MKPWRFLHLAAIALVSLSLAGCFRTVEPLISAGEADFPFETLTYVEARGGDEITLVRAGDEYRPANEDIADRVMFKALDTNLFLVQLLSMETGEPAYLYGLIRLSPDMKSFVMAASVAAKDDLAAVRDGYAGLALCDEDPDTVCIEELDAYKAYALQDKVMSKATAYRIIRMK
jgi:hypothetical protein